MKTDDLIYMIAQDAGAARPRLDQQLVVATGLACGAALLALAATIGVRPDILSALQTWRFDTKVTTVASALLCSWLAMRELARPQAAFAKAGTILVLPLIMLGAASVAELLATPSITWGLRAVGTNARLCLFAIFMLALAPLIILLGAMRGSAPRSPTRAGAATGLLAGCIGALAYAIHCPDDSPLFVVFWYIPPILVLTGFGAALGKPLLRW